MNVLQFVPLITWILFMVMLGAIPAALARRKNRNPTLWWIAGGLGFPIALVSILLFGDLESLSGEQKTKSLLKEKLVLIVILALFVTTTILRILAGRPTG